MSLLRSFHALSFLLVFLSIVALCLARQSLELLLVAGALAAISWTITEGPRGRRLPRWVANVLVLAVTLYAFVVYIQGTHDVLSILGQYALWLTLIKLYERRTPRDHAQALVLSFMLMLISCLHTADLLFGLLLIVYGALGVYVVLLYQLYAAYERNRGARASSISSGFPVAPSVKPVTGRRVGAHLKSLASAVGVFGMVLSVLAFLAFPRGVGEAAVGQFPDPSGSARAGFTGEIDLVHGERITDSRRVVMHVQLVDRNDRVIQHGRPTLLRGSVLDHYSGLGRWRAVDRRRQPQFIDHDQWKNFSLNHPIDGQAVTQHIEVIRSADTGGMIFSMYAPVAIRVEHSIVMSIDPRNLTMRAERDHGWPSRYAVLAHPAPSDSLLRSLHRRRGHFLADNLDDQDAAAQIDRLRSRPIDLDMFSRLSYAGLRDPAIEQYALNLLRNAGVQTQPPDESDPRARWTWHRMAANVFLQHLHSAQFAYTIDLSDVTIPIDPTTGRTMDPIRYFLLKLRRGHCEFFASAFVSMCHNVGVEARMVTGFVCSSFEQRQQRYAVMERNAHAWAEVRTGDYRWTTFDPTPPSVLQEFHHADLGIADQLRWMYDRFDGLWNQSIVSYDMEAQSQIASFWDDEDVAGALAAWMERFRAWLERVNQAFYFGPAGTIYVAFLSGLLLIFLIVLGGLLRRMVNLRRMLHLEHLHGWRSRRMLLQLGFYLDMLRILRRAGQEKPPWRPPMEHAAHLASQHPDVAEPVREITRLFYEARYGQRSLRAEERRQIDQWLERIAVSLRVRRGGWLS